MKVPSLLKNKYVFYGLAVLAVLNVVGYVSVRAYECLALFVLTAYSAHCYCKNESLAVLAALFVANFVFGCGRVKEGFEDALKGPMEHMADAEESERKAKEGFTTASKDNCCLKENDQFSGAWKEFQGTDAEKAAKAALCSAQGSAGEYCTN